MSDGIRPKSIDQRLADYIAEIDKIRRTGGATEHSYRGALQRLLADLMPGLTVLNEPRRIACGTPDYIIAADLLHYKRIILALLRTIRLVAEAQLTN